MSSLDWKTLPRPIVALSPMADMTDSAFCRTVREVNAAAGMTPQDVIIFREMVSSEAVVRGNNKTLDMTDIHVDERPLVQQIFGSDPHTMAEAARIISAQHAPEGFDVNMGCPVYKIVHNFNGAALMKEPERAAAIVRAIKAVITVPLSIKIRLGWSDPTDAREFAKVLAHAGANMITVHGRTKVQGYAGVADWEMIRTVKNNVDIPVLCNGDIHRADLVQTALDTSQCDGVLIARGALGNPWIFSQFAKLSRGEELVFPSTPERVRVIRRHLALHCEQYGDHGVSTFRKHLSWYFKGIPNVKHHRERMMLVKTRQELDDILDGILQHP